MLTANCYLLLKDVEEISEFISKGQFDSFNELEKLLKMETKFMMLLGLAIKSDIETRNPRYLLG